MIDGRCDAAHPGLDDWEAALAHALEQDVCRLDLPGVTSFMHAQPKCEDAISRRREQLTHMSGMASYGVHSALLLAEFALQQAHGPDERPTHDAVPTKLSSHDAVPVPASQRASWLTRACRAFKALLDGCVLGGKPPRSEETDVRPSPALLCEQPDAGVCLLVRV
jgi:hypothetical protein